MTNAWVRIEREEKTLAIFGGGEWNALSIRQIYAPLTQLDFQNITHCTLDFQKVTLMDTSGAWLLTTVLEKLKNLKIKTSTHGIKETFKHLLEQVMLHKGDVKRYTPPLWITEKLYEVGRRATQETLNALSLLSFLGEVSISLVRAILNPQRLRHVSLMYFLEKVGLNALPIVGLISFLIGMVLVYQGADQLKRFGAEIFTVDLLAISVLREIGILLTAIVVAGRSGSSFTAQIGTMKLNQEVDSLQTFGLDPIEILVLPRILALMIALPLLAFFAGIMALLGGALTANLVLDLNYSQFTHQLLQAVQPRTFWIGISKAPVFAFIIALVGCFEGLRVKGGAESIGKQTTRSVVESIFLVIILDAVFSIFFSYIGV